MSQGENRTGLTSRFQSVLLTPPRNFSTFQTGEEIINPCTWWILWEGSLWSLFTGNFASQNTRKRFLDTVTVHPSVLKNDLKLHYRSHKFKLWTRINRHGKTWCWKLSEDSQGLRFWGPWKEAVPKPPGTPSSLCSMFCFLGLQAISLPFVLCRAARIKQEFILSA